MTEGELRRFRRKVKAERRVARRPGLRGPCHVWMAAKNNYGYGVIRLDAQPGERGRLVLAHRLAYEHFVGPIAVGLEPDHLCSQPDCVNPAHVEVVEHAENLRRAHERRPWNLKAA